MSFPVSPAQERTDRERGREVERGDREVAWQPDGPGVLYVTLLGLPKLFPKSSILPLKQAMGPHSCLSISPG